MGDSRAYLLHEGTLIRVTRDHSYVEELVDAGEITADEARVHPNRSVITRALGSDPAMYADHFTLHIEEGDRLILCSDGLSSMIPDSDIENIATQSSTAQICVDNLVDAALAAGGHDNVTVVVVDLVDDGVMREAQRVRRRNITIAAILALVFVLAAGIWAYTGVTGSYYLGTHQGNVAVWRGLPGKPLGLKLHWLESETSIKLSDLPEDTQKPPQGGHSANKCRRCAGHDIQVPPPDRRGADPPGDRRANDSRQHQSGIDLRIRFRENRRTVRRGRSLRKELERECRL